MTSEEIEREWPRIKAGVRFKWRSDGSEQRVDRFDPPTERERKRIATYILRNADVIDWAEGE